MMVVFAIAMSSCGNQKPDYENLSKEELVKLDNDGDIDASLQLGRMAIHNMNMDEAKTYFTKAAEKENPKGLHNLALVNASQNEYTAAITHLEKAMNMGFGPSKAMLASVLISNKTLNRVEEGLKLAEESADNGEKMGYYALAAYYLEQQNKHYTEGDIVYRNMRKAIELGSSTMLFLMVLTDINGGMTREEVIAEMEPYKSSFPKLVQNLTDMVNGNDQAFTSPYYQQGYMTIEDLME